MITSNNSINSLVPGRTFFAFCAEYNLGKWTNGTKEMDPFFELTSEEIHKLIEFNCFFDGTKGGLVLGKLHVDGGVHLIVPIWGTSSYAYDNEMEGWEYLSVPITNAKIGKKFEKLNNSAKTGFTSDIIEFRIPKNCKVIDTLNLSMAVILLSEYRHFIVNRKATKKNIRKIIRIEKKIDKRSI